MEANSVRYKSLLAQLLLSALLLFTQACSTSSQIELSILDKGPFAVSPKNIDVTPNQYLTEQSNLSDSIKAFLEHHGNPDFIELISARDSKVLRLYYLQTNELFPLLYANHTWLILREEQIDPATLTTLKSMSQSSEALQQPGEEQESRVSTGRALSKVISEESDVIYSVAYDGVTLEDIALWYTQDRNNAQVLGRINDLSTTNFIPKGRAVRIPHYMAKTTEPYSPLKQQQEQKQEQLRSPQTDEQQPAEEELAPAALPPARTLDQLQ